MADPRIEPPNVAGEAEMLVAWLDWHLLRERIDGRSAERAGAR